MIDQTLCLRSRHSAHTLPMLLIFRRPRDRSSLSRLSSTISPTVIAMPRLPTANSPLLTTVLPTTRTILTRSLPRSRVRIHHLHYGSSILTPKCRGAQRQGHRGHRARLAREPRHEPERAEVLERADGVQGLRDARAQAARVRRCLPVHGCRPRWLARLARQLDSRCSALCSSLQGCRWILLHQGSRYQ